MNIFDQFSPDILTQKAKALFDEERQTRTVLNG